MRKGISFQRLRRDAGRAPSIKEEAHMQDVFDFADDLGPAKVIHVYEPSVDLKAILVVDNVARGPSIGGVRMACDVSTGECFRLARAFVRPASQAHGSRDPTPPPGYPTEGARQCSSATPRCPSRENRP